MQFEQTRLAGVWHITQQRLADERGFFARTYCEAEFASRGIQFSIKQCNTSFNRFSGTLRGMHYQRAPKPEAKLIRCTAGRIFDVAVDLRPASPSYCQWTSVELTALEGNALLVPAGCAHGFLTLEDDSEVLYQMSEFYAPELACGVRWNDPAFSIEWPMRPLLINSRDAQWPDFTP